MECVIMVGLPASGKSTFAKRRYTDTHIRLNLDMLNTRRKEDILFEACLVAKQPVVIDNTNVTIKERSKYIKKALAEKFSVKCVFMKTPVDLCVQNNTNRKDSVPVVAIYSRAKALEEPTIEEGFDNIEVVSYGNH